MECDVCQENPAAFILGNTETGEQVTFCAPDFARWSVDFAKRILAPEELAGLIGPLLVDSPSVPSQGTKRGGRGRREAAPRPSQGEPEDPPATPVEGEAAESS